LSASTDFQANSRRMSAEQLLDGSESDIHLSHRVVMRKPDSQHPVRLIEL